MNSGNVAEHEQSELPSEAVIELADHRMPSVISYTKAGNSRRTGERFLSANNRTSASLAIPTSRKPNGSARRCCSIQDQQDRSFKLPRGVGILVLTKQGIIPKHILLNDRRAKAKPCGAMKSYQGCVSSGPADLLVKKSGNSENSFSHHWVTHRCYPSRCRPLVRARGG